MRYIRQEGIRDCGVCCLYNIIRYYNGFITIEKLRELTCTNENGTSIYNMVQASNKIGFVSKAYKCTLNDLNKLDFPLIAFIKINNFNHFVIVEEIIDDKIKIFDPIRGKKVYDIYEFNNEWQNIVITLKKDESKELIKMENEFQNYLLKIFNEYKKEIILLMILSFISAIISLLLLSIVKKIIDNNIVSSSFILFLFIVLIKCLIDYIKNKQTIILNSKIDYSLSCLVYEKIYSLPIKYHHNRPVGDITSRINDLYQIKSLINTLALSTIFDIIVLFILLLIILFINFKLFIVYLLISLICIFLHLLNRNKEKELLEEVKDKGAYSSSTFIENIIGIDTIKYLNIDDKIIEKQKNIKNSYIKSCQNFSNFTSIITIISNFLEQYGTLIVLFISYSLKIKGKISVGEITLVYTFFITFINTLKNILSFDKSFIDSSVAFKKINSFLNTDYKENGKKTIKDINSINFNNIVFSYNKKKLLNNISFNINKGDYILINGKSGCGKSSLFRLLNKEYDNYSGKICINNEDIINIKTSSIRNNICYVSQSEFIFTDSIKNNILMYKGINNKEINKVLKVTLLDKVLKDKNINLDYLLEDNGHNLSGGERQKILLARALIQNKDIIIFDETMNEIDVESERKIIENIKADYKKTIVLISHRNNNCDLFNKIIVI